MPDIQALYENTKQRVHILSIIADEPSTVKSYANTKGYRFPILYDARQHASRAYKVRSLPTTVIIDSDGKIVHDFSGAADIDILKRHIDKLSSK